MTTQEILQEARDWITPRRRWIKGDFDNGHGAFCAIGAINRSAKRNGLGYGAALGAHKVLGEVIPGHSIAEYNDAKATTHECILAAFDAAIEKAGQS